jgi:hypothetical protein
MLRKGPRTCAASGGVSHILQLKGRWRAASSALSVLAVLGGPEGAAETTGKLDAVRLAQRADQPSISVAPTIDAKPGSQVLLTIQVRPPEVLSTIRFVTLSGLPPSVSLSVGHSFVPGSWLIPAGGLARLTANIPYDSTGRANIVIGLIGMDGRLVAEARTALVVGPEPMMAPAAKAPIEPQQKRSGVVPPPDRSDRTSPAAPRPVELSAADRGRAEQLVAQGDRYLAQSKIAGARLFFGQAADMGLAVGAIRLAATYDPAELSRLRVQGITPDPAEARKWYERARELGAPEAEHRLARLGGN